MEKKLFWIRLLGSLGLILAILSLIISFIPCIGFYAIYPGILALIISTIAFVKNKKHPLPGGMFKVALILSILGVTIALYQWFFWN